MKEWVHEIQLQGFHGPSGEWIVLKSSYQLDPPYMLDEIDSIGYKNAYAELENDLKELLDIKEGHSVFYPLMIKIYDSRTGKMDIDADLTKFDMFRLWTIST